MSIALVIAKTIFDANNDPEAVVSFRPEARKNERGKLSAKDITHQRFVNTTPNPKATKKSNGELVGPGVEPPVGVALADEVEVVEVADMIGVEVREVILSVTLGIVHEFPKCMTICVQERER